MPIPLAGQTILASDAFNLQTYTPTWTNVILGTGADNEGWWQQIGQMVLWGFRLQLGTSPSTSGTIEISLPVAAYTGGGASLQAALGSWVYRDDSGPDHWSGSLGSFEAAGLNASLDGVWDGTSNKTRFGTVVSTARPAVVAVSDVISGSGCYRSAS
jgi:hypothetical protein